MDIWHVCHEHPDDEPQNPCRLAALAWQLPKTSRIWRALDPSGGYDTATLLLRQLEYDVRAFHWSFTEDGKNKVNEPELITLPGEEEAHERAAEEADSMALELARVFGLNI